MVKIQKISEIEPRLGFTEFDMLKKYRQSFATSELGRLHALFPFSDLVRQMHLKSSALGREWLSISISSFNADKGKTLK